MYVSSADVPVRPRWLIVSPGDHATTAVQDKLGENLFAQECNNPVSPSDVRDHDLESDSYPFRTAVQVL